MLPSSGMVERPFWISFLIRPPRATVSPSCTATDVEILRIEMLGDWMAAVVS